ncbi:E3 ubiquitin-protein ligase FANCL-like [Halichondria panicea]|uniref:E3 ubiquitin-protein ligase FANCL-like n=1 Tax=Halichondria panicea TaxID=6063 RepID=UPI00312BC9D7
MVDGVLILPASLEESVFRGFINTPEHSYEVKVTLSSSNQISDARVEGDWRLSNLIRGQEDTLQQYLTESKTVPELLGKMRDLLTQLESSKPSPLGLALPLSVCRQLANDIDSLGWSRVQTVDTLFRHIQLVVRDQKNQAHTLTVSPTAKYPHEAPILTVDAPVDFKPHWDKTTGLCGLVSQFSSWLDTLGPFWSCMEELDAQTCILEPEHPSRAHTHRRILIDTHLSLVLTVNPLKPLILPEPLQFLGPDNRVRELRGKVGRNCTQWNERRSLLANLQSLLDLQFLKPSSKEAEEMSEECAICYDYRLNGVVPSVICPNNHCAKCYHNECFEEWLRGLPRADGLHTVLAGDCPFCGEVISLR